MVSIKLLQDVPGTPVKLVNDTERMRGVTSLWALLMSAYDISYFRLDAPEWTKWSYYDVEAIAPKGTPNATRFQMLQSVLVDRLGLKYHFDERPASVHVLSAVPGALKLTRVDGDAPPWMRYNPNEFKQASASMANLAFWLSNEFKHDVVDETHLDGRYAFNLDWSGMREGDGTADSGLVNKALKSVGLKIEPRRQMMKYLIVDRINKTPTAN